MDWHRTSLAAALAVSVAGLAWSGTAQAEEKSLTLCWAAWDPANALVELSKDFTKEWSILAIRTTCISNTRDRPS